MTQKFLTLKEYVDAPTGEVVITGVAWVKNSYGWSNGMEVKNERNNQFKNERNNQ